MAIGFQFGEGSGVGGCGGVFCSEAFVEFGFGGDDGFREFCGGISMFIHRLGGGLEGAFEFCVDRFDGLSAEEGEEFAFGFFAGSDRFGVGFFEGCLLFLGFSEARVECFDGGGFFAAECFRLDEGFSEGMQLGAECFERVDERLGGGCEVVVVIGMGGEQGLDGGFERGQLLGELDGAEFALLQLGLKERDVV